MGSLMLLLLFLCLFEGDEKKEICRLMEDSVAESTNLAEKKNKKTKKWLRKRERGTKTKGGVDASGMCVLMWVS